MHRPPCVEADAMCAHLCMYSCLLGWVPALERGPPAPFDPGGIEREARMEGEAGMEVKARMEGEAAAWQAPAGQGG